MGMEGCLVCDRPQWKTRQHKVEMIELDAKAMRSAMGIRGDCS